MIGALRGRVAEKTPGQVLVDVGGVVYDVAVSLQSYARLPGEGEPVRLDVVTHLREDALVLFGFLDRDEKDMFNCLRTVSGVGPRLALNVLSGIPSRDLRGALAAGDVDRLCRVPGVGKKTAERLVLELRDKSRTVLDTSGEPAGATAARSRDAEAISALVNLGYKRGEAERVMKTIAADIRLEDAIREALRRFAR
jgi:Holliday junction DNA helicase RuvA